MGEVGRVRHCRTHTPRRDRVGSATAPSAQGGRGQTPSVVIHASRAPLRSSYIPDLLAGHFAK
eukprot:6489337-Prymnesium_polylepis.1